MILDWLLLLLFIFFLMLVNLVLELSSDLFNEGIGRDNVLWLDFTEFGIFGGKNGNEARDQFGWTFKALTILCKRCDEII